MNFNNAEFVLSAASKEEFIHDSRPQVAFAGRSNVGKSSTINRILNRKNFARVSTRPGKTIHVNYFLIDQRLYLVDLPGYGYAQVSKAERDRWGSLMDAYFAGPDTLDVGVLIVDARHNPTMDDCTMADWFRETGCPLVVVANKVDKVKKSELEQKMEDIRVMLQLEEDCILIPFSAETGTGKDRLVHTIMDLAGMGQSVTQAR